MSALMLHERRRTPKIRSSIRAQGAFASGFKSRPPADDEVMPGVRAGRAAN